MGTPPKSKELKGITVGYSRNISLDVYKTETHMFFDVLRSIKMKDFFEAKAFFSTETVRFEQGKDLVL